MKLLLDTHLLVWASDEVERLSPATVAMINDDANELMFSAASIWEISIKWSLGKEGFGIHPRVLQRGLIDNGYSELAITSEHAFFISTLPPLHRDPFDRILVAQATVEGIILLTADPIVAQYPGPIQQV